MAEVWLAYTKYDGSLHWHQKARRLGEDEHGVWLGGTKGTVVRKGHDDVVTEAAWAHVVLIPHNAWWTAAFNGPGARNEIYCDIATPAIWPHPGEVTMVDLDLDVLRMKDGRVLLDDADEFAEHQVRYAYPPDVVANAEASARWLLDAVRDRRGPFGGAHLPYLKLVSD
ncbi:MAG: DUF402 domain-containing protein [Hamadaea sp.]|nr:DUF402 domain-containing protein [Hamadaea sp.]NUR49973.1 DUF402 domain-containing protein [Hamadaea sp.]NUT04650.1 DUF402 domain-containing protein [Hamadaea sp.]